MVTNPHIDNIASLQALESTALEAYIAESPTSTQPSPLRKIVLMVGVAILVFLGVTAFSVKQSFHSNDQLTAVRDLYFPVLQKIESNIVRLDKMEELFTRSVMIGEHDPLDEAAEFYKAGDQDFAEMVRIYPARQADIQNLRTKYKEYHDVAHAMAEEFLRKQAGDRAQTKRMNDLLTALRESIKQFRESSYGNFVATLADTQNTGRRNLVMGVALGLMNLAFMGVLVFFIRNNVRMMGVIEEQNATLERRVAERTAQLRQKTNDIQSMLQNMPQGVLTVLPGGKIHPEYSAYLETIFMTSTIAEQPVLNLVFGGSNIGSNDLSQVEATLDSCIGEDRMNFEFNSHLLVSELQRVMPDQSIKSLELSWSPICNENDLVEKLMLCVRDVTELKRLAQEASAQKRELEIVGQILAVSQEKFQEFLNGAHHYVAENESAIIGATGKDARVIGELFRNMHTIKGNARTYGLKHLVDAVHEAEQEYDDLRQDPEQAWDPEGLLTRLRAVRQLLEEYRTINEETLGRKGPGRRGSVERFLLVDKEQVGRALELVQAARDADMDGMRNALTEAAKTLSLVGTESMAHLLEGIVASLPSLAKELGKEPPVVDIADHGIALRTQIAGVLKDVFTHLLRNSLDHGLENADERLKAGKNPVGRIQLEVTLDDRLRLTLRDDGRGLALDRILRKAIAQGLLGEDEGVGPHALAQLIFASGFSTAEQVTDVSGRGVGMDAVRGFLQKEGGDIEVCLTGKEGTAVTQRAFELRITLPAKLAVKAA